MPRVFLSDEDRSSHRLAAWVIGEKKVRRMTDTELAKKRGISQQAMSKKFREESFSFKDFVFFALTFQMDNQALQYIIGTKKED